MSTANQETRKLAAYIKDMGYDILMNIPLTSPKCVSSISWA